MKIKDEVVKSMEKWAKELGPDKASMCLDGENYFILNLIEEVKRKSPLGISFYRLYLDNIGYD